MFQRALTVGGGGGGKTADSGSFSATINNTNTISCGFRPNHVIVYFNVSTSAYVLDADGDTDKIYRSYGGSIFHSDYGSPTSGTDNIQFTDDGFKFLSAWTSTCYYLASVD